MNVAVGSTLNPKKLPGAAFLLKVMLMQGSKRYPDNKYFDEYLKKYKGRHSEVASITDTNYHFQCDCEGLEGALDRFASYFICPTFGNHDTLSNEEAAVDLDIKLAKLVDNRI